MCINYLHVPHRVLPWITPGINRFIAWPGGRDSQFPEELSAKQSNVCIVNCLNYNRRRNLCKLNVPIYICKYLNVSLYICNSSYNHNQIRLPLVVIFPVAVSNVAVPFLSVVLYIYLYMYIYIYVMWSAYQVYPVECVFKIKAILLITLYAIYGVVRFQLNYFSCDDCQNIYTSSYFHHEIVCNHVMYEINMNS